MVVLDVIHRIQATQAPDLAVPLELQGRQVRLVQRGDRRQAAAHVHDADGHSSRPARPITVAPIRTFPIIRDLVTDVSYNYEKAKQVPPLRLKPPEPDGTYRMMQEDIDRVQEFHKCIECFLCQDVCHVIRDHEEHKTGVLRARASSSRPAGLDMHPLDTRDRTRVRRGRRPASGSATSPSAAPRSAPSTSTSPTTPSSR